MTHELTESASSLQLTHRDFEIFRLIESGGAKTSNELSEQFWNERSQKTKAGFQRIRKLIKAGFLTRGNPKLLYLSERAKVLLSKQETPVGVEEERHDG